jgi:hypothetical protein
MNEPGSNTRTQRADPHADEWAGGLHTGEQAGVNCAGAIAFADVHAAERGWVRRAGMLVSTAPQASAYGTRSNAWARPRTEASTQPNATAQPHSRPRRATSEGRVHRLECVAERYGGERAAGRARTRTRRTAEC